MAVQISFVYTFSSLIVYVFLIFYLFFITPINIISAHLDVFQQILPSSRSLNSTIPLIDPKYMHKDIENDFAAHNETFYEIFQKIITTSINILVEEEFEVEAVLGTKTSSIGETEYLVSWKNYSNRSNSWVKKDDT
jgi:hypothetical protein